MKNSILIRELQEQRKKLSLYIRKAEARLQKAPEGTVRIVKYKKGYQYYLRTNPADTIGVYIPVSERSKAIELIQKGYDSKIVKAAKKQQMIIDRFLKGYDPDCLKKVYSSLSEARKKDIAVIEKSDRDYIREWQSVEYTSKPFAEGIPEHYTCKGERVRSKSEVMIADALSRAKVPYRYESELNLHGIVIHPDFTILRIEDRKEIYWEHLGMMDDPDYCYNALQRLRLYEENGLYPGIDVIVTMETTRLPINQAVIKKMIKIFCV